jgi:alkylation response protein AidB-like acyl-CoA dehydrogenase
VDLALSEEQRAVRDAFGSVLAKESSMAQVRQVESAGFDPQLWSAICGMGAIDVGIPADLGGGGAGLVELSLIAEEMGRHIAPVPFAEPAAAARLCARIGATELVTAVVEGGRLVSFTPSIQPIEDQLLTDGAVADVVLAWQSDQVVVYNRPDDVRLVQNAGGLPLARWLGARREVVDGGHEAALAVAAACDDVRLLRAAALVGLAARAIEIGAAYARERLAFGIPIGSYQAVAHPLADAVALADGVQLLVRKAAWATDERLVTGPTLASEAFVAASELAQFATQHSLHIHGGYGFTQEYDIQLYYRRAKAWTLCVGDPSRELAVLADRLFGPVA